jgi:hypothetical protein
MANNLHISYDLKNPERDYAKVIAAIKQLGSWAKIHYSFWFVKSNFTATQARDYLLKHIDSNDSIYVADATNNDAAWHNIPDDSSRFIREIWRAKAA